MKRVKPPIVIAPPNGRVLVIAPHPDDESCGVGGTLALHRKQGDPVTVVFLTDGDSGDPDGHYGDKIGERRRREAQHAAVVLGGLETRFLGLPDGHEVRDDDLRMVAQMLDDIADSLKPDLVYVPWAGE